MFTKFPQCNPCWFGRAICLCSVFLILMIQKPLLAQDEDLTILDDWLIYSDASNALYHHLVDQARGLLDQPGQTHTFLYVELERELIPIS